MKKSHDDALELAEIAGLLKAKKADIPEKLAHVLQQLKDTEKELQQLKKAAALSDMDSIVKDAVTVGDVTVVAAQAQADSMDSLREVSDTVLDKTHGVVLLAMVNDGKVNFVCKVEKALTKKGLHAGKIIKAAAQAAGGNGGGRPDMAQAGGKDASKVDAALQAGIEAVKSLLA